MVREVFPLRSFLLVTRWRIFCLLVPFPRVGVRAGCVGLPEQVANSFRRAGFCPPLLPRLRFLFVSPLPKFCAGPRSLSRLACARKSFSNCTVSVHLTARQSSLAAVRVYIHLKGKVCGNRSNRRVLPSVDTPEDTGQPRWWLRGKKSARQR